jgi:hypothetical protein
MDLRMGFEKENTFCCNLFEVWPFFGVDLMDCFEDYKRKLHLHDTNVMYNKLITN